MPRAEEAWEVIPTHPFICLTVIPFKQYILVSLRVRATNVTPLIISNTSFELLLDLDPTIHGHPLNLCLGTATQCQILLARVIGRIQGIN